MQILRSCMLTQAISQQVPRQRTYKKLQALTQQSGPCRNGFEGKLSALSQFQTDEANALMTKALTAMDMMNNAIELQNEVSPAAGAMLSE